VLEDARSATRSLYRPITHNPITFVAFMYTRETRLRWGFLPFVTGDQTMSVLVVPANVSFQALPDGGWW
jgi:hypothetical protein